MRERSRICKWIQEGSHFDYALQRAFAALRADAVRCLAVSFLALAFPPLKPPSLPSATAAGFFFWSAFVRERLGMSHDCDFRKS